MESNINITNIVNVTGDAGESTGSVAWLPRLLFFLVALAAVGYGSYWLALAVIDLAIGIGEGIGNLLGALSTGVLDLTYGAGHLMAHYAPTALWGLGYGCLALVGLAIIGSAYSRWLDWAQTPTVRVVNRELPAPRVLVLVASTQDQAAQAIKALPDSASYEFIQMPAQKETVRRE